MIASAFRQSMSVFLACFLTVSSIGSAAAETMADIMPDDVTIYGQMDLAQLTPKSLLDTLVNFAMGKISGTGLESSIDDDTETAKKRTSLAMDIMTNGPFATGMGIEESFIDQKNYFIATINDAQWASYLELNAKNLEKKTDATHEYYVEKSSEKSVARMNQFFIGANSEEGIKSFFGKVDKGETLGKNKHYQATIGNGTAALFSGYNDLSSALREVKDEIESGNDAKQSIFDMAQHMGYAMKQFSGGIELSTVTTRDAAQKNSIYTPSTFTPLLYQYATAQHPLLYLEASNLAKGIAQIKSIEDFDIGEELELNSKKRNLVFERDILNLLTKGYSLTMEKGEKTFLPSFTLMADVKENAEAMKTGLKKVYNTLTSKKLPDGVIVSGPSSSNDNLYNFSISFVPDEAFWYDFETYFPRTSTTLSLTVNLTNEGILVISTKPDAMKTYKTGMDIAEFGDIGTRTDVSGLFSLNINEITKIAKEAVQQYYAGLDEEFRHYMNVETTINAIDQILSPWQRISASITSTNSTGSGTLKIFFDPKVYENAYWSDAIKAIETVGESSDKYERITSKFSDVPREEWYAHDVKNLKARGVVNGYADNSFKPEQMVTRIEFLAMLYRGVYGEAPSSFSMDNGGLKDESEGGDDVIFSDVEPFEWYYDILQDSVKKGLVKGYADNTFKPEAMITRSEAVAMTARFYEYNNDVEFFVNLPWRDDKTFADVTKNAWFNKAVHDSYMLGIVDGTPAGRFEPTRSLNRAEAAKLISRLLRKKTE